MTVFTDVSGRKNVYQRIDHGNTVSVKSHAGVNGSTTARVTSIKNKGNAIAYTYDQNENIETISEDSKLTKYYYNELNEVIREDNGDLSKSITYTSFES